MEYRKLGHSGLSVSSVSLGTWKNIYASADLDGLQKLYRRAFDLGINFFDTANNYEAGLAERFLGRLSVELGRQNLVLATKCFFPISDNVNARGLSRKHIMDSVHRSLQNLGTDHIDVLQCHRWDKETPIEETIDAMDTLTRQGKILYWGLGAATAAQVVETCLKAKLKDQVLPVSHQHIYHMFNRTVEAESLRAGEAFGVGLLVYSPLAQGVLSGKYVPGNIPENSRAFAEENRKTMWDFSEDKLQKAAELKKIANEISMPLSTMALAWSLRHKSVSSVICGVKTEDQLQQNIAASGTILSQDILDKIENILQNRPLNQYTNQILI